MEKYKFDRQISTELYRKWYLIAKKDPNNQYDKEQVDDLNNALKLQIGFIIEQYAENELFSFRGLLPFLYINDKKFEEFEIEILVIDNTIECINIPGCIVEGENRKTAFEDLLKVIIQCCDARIQNGLWFLNRVFPMKSYGGAQSISSSELIKNLKERGWTTQYFGPYHTVLLCSRSKVTYTIPNNSEISSSLHFRFNRLQFLSNWKNHKEMYEVINENDYWTCDICGGSSSTGCLYFDSTECPKIIKKKQTNGKHIFIKLH